MAANPIDDDFNQSPEDLAIWLDRKYARHGEDEDRQAAAMLRQYAALTAAQQQGQAVACGGCGNADPDKVCIGCLHPFAAPQPMQQGGGEVVDAVRFLAGVRVFLASRERIKQPEGLRMFDEAIEILRKTHEVDNA